MAWKYRKNISNNITAVASEKEGELWIYGEISSRKYGDDTVTPLSIKNSLDEIGKVNNLILRVNSTGGSVPAGNSIIDILDMYRKRTGCTITAYIEGLAASMGSGIPMVADKIYMAENSLYMLHKPFSIVYGNVKDLEKEIEILSKAEDTLVKNYMRHFNGTEKELREMLAEETWLTADEALQFGLCDEIIESVPVAASCNGITINGSEFRRMEIAAKFGYNIPVAKTNGKVEEPKMFEYDNELMNYGISEEVFKKMNIESNTVISIAASIKTQMDATKQDEFISSEKAKKFFNSNSVTAEEILNDAKQWRECSTELDKKAKLYEKMFNCAVDEAIRNGIRAKGETFNETKWKKILSLLDYDEVIEQGNEWEEEAKTSLKAGKNVSERWQGTTENSEVDDTTKYLNLNDYRF